MGCGFEQYLLTFQWDWSRILPAPPKIEISQDRLVPTASCLPTARFLGVRSFSELLTKHSLHTSRAMVSPLARAYAHSAHWKVWKAEFDTKVKLFFFCFFRCTCTDRSYYYCHLVFYFRLQFSFAPSLFQACQWTTEARAYTKQETLCNFKFDDVFALP